MEAPAGCCLLSCCSLHFPCTRTRKAQSRIHRHTTLIKTHKHSTQHTVVAKWYSRASVSLCANPAPLSPTHHKQGERFGINLRVVVLVLVGACAVLSAQGWWAAKRSCRAVGVQGGAHSRRIRLERALCFPSLCLPSRKRQCS